MAEAVARAPARAPDLDRRRHAGGRAQRLAGSPDHQGIVAEVDPYPYADPTSLLDRPDALIVALDQVQDPHNLGAVCRSAEAAGAAGVVIRERRAAGVTAAVCKASAGAVEHLAVARVTNLADWLAAAKDARARGSMAPTPTPSALRRRRPHRPDRARARQRGEGAPPARRRRLRPTGLDPGRRRGRLAERLGRGRGAALRGRAPAPAGR